MRARLTCCGFSPAIRGKAARRGGPSALPPPLGLPRPPWRRPCTPRPACTATSAHCTHLPANRQDENCWPAARAAPLTLSTAPTGSAILAARSGAANNRGEACRCPLALPPLYPCQSTSPAAAAHLLRFGPSRSIRCTLAACAPPPPLLCPATTSAADAATGLAAASAPSCFAQPSFPILAEKLAAREPWALAGACGRRRSGSRCRAPTTTSPAMRGERRCLAAPPLPGCSLQALSSWRAISPAARPPCRRNKSMMRTATDFSLQVLR